MFHVATSNGIFHFSVNDDKIFFDPDHFSETLQSLYPVKIEDLKIKVEGNAFLQFNISGIIIEYVIFDSETNSLYSLVRD